jgi:hypothetical protein
MEFCGVEGLSIFSCNSSQPSPYHGAIGHEKNRTKLLQMGVLQFQAGIEQGHTCREHGCAEAVLRLVWGVRLLLEQVIKAGTAKAAPPCCFQSLAVVGGMHRPWASGVCVWIL